MNTPKFQIGDIVYHATPDSPKGIVIDIKYGYRTREHEYRVAFAPDVDSLWYYVEELSGSPIF